MKHRGSPGLTASQLLPAQPLPRSQALLRYDATIKSRLNYARVAPALSLSPIRKAFVSSGLFYRIPPTEALQRHTNAQKKKKRRF